MYVKQTVVVSVAYLCFFLSGILTLTLTNPIWVTKTQLVLQYNADPTRKHYKGMVDALVKIYRYEGIPGLYRVRLSTQQCLSSVCMMVTVWWELGASAIKSQPYGVGEYSLNLG